METKRPLICVLLLLSGLPISGCGGGSSADSDAREVKALRAEIEDGLKPGRPKSDVIKFFDQKKWKYVYNGAGNRFEAYPDSGKNKIPGEPIQITQIVINLSQNVEFLSFDVIRLYSFL